MAMFNRKEQEHMADRLWQGVLMVDYLAAKEIGMQRPEGYELRIDRWNSTGKQMTHELEYIPDGRRGKWPLLRTIGIDRPTDYDIYLLAGPQAVFQVFKENEVLKRYGAAVMNQFIERIDDIAVSLCDPAQKHYVDFVPITTRYVDGIDRL
jgi:hypothetical protein